MYFIFYLLNVITSAREIYLKRKDLRENSESNVFQTKSGLSEKRNEFDKRERFEHQTLRLEDNSLQKERDFLQYDSKLLATATNSSSASNCHPKQFFLPVDDTESVENIKTTKNSKMSAKLDVEQNKTDEISTNHKKYENKCIPHRITSQTDNVEHSSSLSLYSCVNCQFNPFSNQIPIHVSSPIIEINFNQGTTPNFILNPNTLSELQIFDHNGSRKLHFHHNMKPIWQYNPNNKQNIPIRPSVISVPTVSDFYCQDNCKRFRQNCHQENSENTTVSDISSKKIYVINHHDQTSKCSEAWENEKLNNLTLGNKIYWTQNLDISDQRLKINQKSLHQRHISTITSSNSRSFYLKYQKDLITIENENKSEQIIPNYPNFWENTNFSDEIFFNEKFSVHTDSEGVSFFHYKNQLQMYCTEQMNSSENDHFKQTKSFLECAKFSKQGKHSPLVFLLTNETPVYVKKFNPARVFMDLYESLFFETNFNDFIQKKCLENLSWFLKNYDLIICIGEYAFIWSNQKVANLINSYECYTKFSCNKENISFDERSKNSFFESHQNEKLVEPVFLNEKYKTHWEKQLSMCVVAIHSSLLHYKLEDSVLNAFCDSLLEQISGNKIYSKYEFETLRVEKNTFGKRLRCFFDSAPQKEEIFEQLLFEIDTKIHTLYLFGTVPNHISQFRQIC